MARSFVTTELAAKFDRRGVFGAIEKKDRKVLGRTGAYGRQVMRRGMRRKKGVSAPSGTSYPNAHAGQLRDLIFFNVDVKAGETLIGPLLFKGSDFEPSAGIETAPQLINKGGRVRKQIGRMHELRTLVYTPRPFVELSTETTADRMFKLYNDLPLKK